MSSDPISKLLIDNLSYEPVPLQFGTSGRRGLVVNLTQLEIAINVSAELEYLTSLPKSAGGISPGEDFYIGYDLRPSSTQFVAEFAGRGQLFHAIWLTVKEAGFNPVNLGPLPTPAVMLYATNRHCASIMVTGSHIPFDRNGYKLNTSIGELLKEDEQPITRQVEDVRKRFYSAPADLSPFNSDGMYKTTSSETVSIDTRAIELYKQRYVKYFGTSSLSGLRLLVYQHAAVGRDFLVDLLRSLGAEVVAVGRSEMFVPIDTEAIDAEQITTIQNLVDLTSGSYDAVVSTDGDSDRPLILGIDNGKVHFFSGDLLGIITAQHIHADAVVVPISCNDAIDLTNLKSCLFPKTRIGSPYVISEMRIAVSQGKTRVCGWEANGGFLLGSDLVSESATLSKLQTRDAILPIITVLAAAKAASLSVCELFDELPKRFGRASLIRNFPRATSLKIVELLKPTIDPPNYISFVAPANSKSDSYISPDGMSKLKGLVERFFSITRGFSPAAWVDYTDGVRIGFTNGDVAHVRPSGNADEMRIYSVANSPERAETIVAQGVKEPDGILRQLQAYSESSSSTSKKVR